MTYKQAIQKSLPKQTNKEPLPIVSTGTNTEAKTEPSKENPPAEKAEAPLDLSIDKLFPPSFSIDYSLPFHDEPKYDLGYYDYPPENGYGMPYREDWWPKTHYGQWREREMGLERNSYLQDPGLSPFIDYGTLPTYSSEELQRVLEMSNPSARATGITVPQYLGLDLDSASDTQLSMLMDMHMEAIKQITVMKVRLAKNNERLRLLQPREPTSSEHPKQPASPLDKGVVS